MFVASGSLAQTPSPSPADLTALPEAPVHTVTKSSSGDQVQLGDRIALDVEIKPEWVRGDAQFKLTVPEGSSQLPELGWYLDPTTLWVAGSLRITVSPIKPGRLTLPTLVVQSKDQDFVAIARTQPFSANVIAPDKPKENPDLLDPAPVSLPTKFVLLGALCVLALGAGVAYALKRLRRRPNPAPVAPPAKVDEPEHVLAVRRIENLYQEHPHSMDAAKPISFGISEILKAFFSARFQIEASEATTGEMLSLLRSVGVGGSELREVSDFFNELDQIKFVKPEHLGPYTHDTHQRFKIKALAIVSRWSRQSPAATAQPQPNRGAT